MKSLNLLLSFLFVLTLAACGGDSSDKAGAAADQDTIDGHLTPDNVPAPGGETAMSAATRATSAISVVSTGAPVNGTVPAGSAKNVAALYHGPASDGELVQFTVNFAALTYYWSVVDSSFGIGGQSGSGSLTVDPGGAGYTMSEGGTLFITNAGGILVDGLVLFISGNAVPQAVFAQPATVESVEISDIAGIYVFGQFTHNVANHAPFPTDTAKVYWGTAQIDLYGVMRMCVGTDFSPTCGNFIERQLVVNDQRCAIATNLVAAYAGTQFVGCMVVSTNGVGNVLHVDMQASATIDPGVTMMVQKSNVLQSLPNGTYAAAMIVDLANGTDGCGTRDITVEGAALTATCYDVNGAAERFTFTLGTAAPLPATTLVMIEDGPTDLFLQLASDLWVTISPTYGWTGTSRDDFGAMSILKRLN